MGIRTKLLPVSVQPPLLGPIAKILPNCDRVAILRFLRYEVSSLKHQNLSRRLGQRMNQRASPRTGTNNDDVVMFGRHLALVC